MDNTIKLKIFWKDGRSETRIVASSELPKWERKVGKGQITKIEELND